MASRCSDSPARGRSSDAALRRGLDPPYIRVVSSRILHGCGARCSDARRCSSPCATGAPRRPRVSAPPSGSAPLQKEAEALATQESALLVELRRFEVERQLEVEELGQLEARPRDARSRRWRPTAAPGGDAAPHGGDASALNRTAPRARLQARAGRILAPAARRRQPAVCRPRLSDRRRADAHRSRSRRRASAHARGARPGTAGRCGNGSRTSRSSRSRRARPARRPTALSEPDRRSSRRSTPAAI